MSDQIKQSVEKMFVNPDISAKVVNALTSTKPVGWSHRSHAPYYKKIYANEIKPFIDQMMADKNDIIYKYSVWCNEETNVSPQTVYNRVNQSLRYLMENMDADRKYADWYEMVRVERVKGLGVRISYIPGFGNNDEVQLRPESVSPKNTKPLWYRKMDEWIEDSDNYEPFVKEGLALTQDEIVELKVRLSGLANIQASITQDRVAIIRLNV